jgi:hypothetical protein
MPATLHPARYFDPKESATRGGFVIWLPAAQRNRIASYRYVWYEDTQVIGTR